MRIKTSKLITLGLLLGILSGCVVSSTDLAPRYANAIEEAITQEMNVYNSMTRELFSYYLPLSIGRRMSTETSMVLISHQEEILMNLDVISILNKAYYQSDAINVLRSSVSINEALYRHEGSFHDMKGDEVKYQVSANPLSDQDVLLTLETEYFIFSSIHPYSISSDILYDMIRIARSAQIEKEMILSTFSNREIIDYQKETLNMFAQLAPETGTVIDMIEGEDKNLFDDNYYDAGPLVEDVPIE